MAIETSNSINVTPRSRSCILVTSSHVSNSRYAVRRKLPSWEGPGVGYAEFASPTPCIISDRGVETKFASPTPYPSH